MNSEKFKTKLQASDDQKITCGRTGIKYTLRTVTDEQIEAMVKAGSKAFQLIDPDAEPIAPVKPARKKRT